MEKQLISLAQEARLAAYAPYSKFKVGAALLCKDGSIYTGCNVENASFGLTNCAERTAIFKAVSEGRTQFTAIAICGGKDGMEDAPCPPCGACRQVLREFCDDNFTIHLLGKAGIESYTLKELLPMSFKEEL